MLSISFDNFSNFLLLFIGHWNALDSIYRHPTGNGIIYVGNQTAAENFTLLRSHGITHVVNCTHGESKIPNYHEGKLAYLTFPVIISLLFLLSFLF